MLPVYTGALSCTAGQAAEAQAVGRIETSKIGVVIMKVLTIQGSPHRTGNTATLLKYFEQIISENNTIERINITDMKVGGCLGCDNCQNNEIEPSCIQKDDMKNILEKVLDADIVVYASPVYVWDFTAQMKCVMDRHYALVKWKYYENKSLVKNKKTILLATCGGDRNNNSDLITQIFEREMRYMQCLVMGKIIVDNCTTPKELDPRREEIVNQMKIDFQELIFDKT